MENVCGTVPPIEETELRRLSTPGVFQRGVSYLESDAIQRIARRGDTVQASVQGSYPDPYQVRLRTDQDGIQEASCTCPYDHGGLCKHLVAVGLCLVRRPERIEERAPVEDQLDHVPRETLVDLITHLVEREPALTDVLEAWIAANPAKPKQDAEDAPGGTTSRAQPAVDPARYRERVRTLVHSLDGMRRSQAYWHVSDVVDDVIQVGREAEAFLEADRPEEALAVLDAVTEAYQDEWLTLDGSDGSTPCVFYDLAPLWLETLLELQLDGQPGVDLDELAGKLDAWVGNLLDYGVSGALDGPLIAAREGWDAVSGSQQASHLEPGPPPRDEEGFPDYEAMKRRERADAMHEARDEVAEAALNVLERRDRHEEALALAQTHARLDRAAAILASMGDTNAAVDLAREQVRDPGQVLAIARALHREGEPGPALELAAGGLGLDGPSDDRAELARWVEEVACEQGKREIAVNALRVGFLAEPTIRRLEALGELAVDDAEELREDLLDQLERASDVDPFARVDLLLHAGRVQAAVEAVRGEGHHALIEPVAEAAIDVDPAWVIEASLDQAEPIIEKGRSKQYEHAVHWLDRARRAWITLGEDEAWEAYLAGIREEHNLKRKLMGLLDERFG